MHDVGGVTFDRGGYAMTATLQVDDDGVGSWRVTGDVPPAVADHQRTLLEAVYAPADGGPGSGSFGTAELARLAADVGGECTVPENKRTLPKGAVI